MKSLGALALGHKAPTLCHRNRFAALAKDEDADDSRGMPSNEDFPELVGSHMLASCQHCWEPSCGEKAVAGFAPRPRPTRRKTHWTKFADTDVNEDGAETQEERTFGVLQPLWKPSQGTSLCPLKRAAVAADISAKKQWLTTVPKRLWRLVGRFQDAHAQVP